MVSWLKLPPEQRPHFITLYYYQPDHSGHENGPDSPEVRDAVHHVDDLMGKLKSKLDALHLPIDLIVVSDHGMEKVQGTWINLDQYADLTNFDYRRPAPLSQLPAEAEAAEKAYNQLKKADSRFTVYRRANVPAALRLQPESPRRRPRHRPHRPLPLIRAHAPTQPETQNRPPPVGMHGYDPASMKTMRAIFYATGPDIRPGSTVKPFENVNVYPLVAHLLGLDPPKVDGSLNVLSGILSENPPADQATNQ